MATLTTLLLLRNDIGSVLEVLICEKLICCRHFLISWQRATVRRGTCVCGAQQVQLISCKPRLEDNINMNLRHLNCDNVNLLKCLTKGPVVSSCQK